MKRLILLIPLLAIFFAGYSQSEGTLPLKTSSLSTDTIRVIKDGESALMPRSVLLGDVEDTLDIHLDTLQVHQTQIAALQAGSLVFDEGLTETTGTVTLGGAFDSNILIESTNSSDIELRSGDGSNYGWLRAEGGNTTVMGVIDGSFDVSTIEIDLTSMEIADEINSKGLEYEADYSTNFTDRSLVDKEYVDNVVGTVYTFENGLTETTGTVTLGGALTGNTNITAASTYDMSLGTSGSPLKEFYIWSDEVAQMRCVSGSNLGYFTAQSNFVSLTAEDAVGEKTISFSSTSMSVTDNQDEIGLEYTADYSSNYTDRSLVDKEYVDLAVAAGSGDVTKVGTPVDWQIGVWTGDGTMEGLTEFTWDSNNKRFRVGDYGTPAYYQIAIGGFHPITSLVANGHPSHALISYHNDADIRGHLNFQKYGGTEASSVTVPSNAEIGALTYQAYDGTSLRNIGEFLFQVDGAVATDDFDTKFTWQLKEGASASALKMTLDTDGLKVEEAIIQTPISASLTDGAPTDAEIDAATGTTPAAAGSGWKRLILDSDGSGLMYIIVSDGSSWQYTVMAIAS